MLIFLTKFPFIYDTDFSFGGYENNWNYRLWGLENSKVIIEKPVYAENVVILLEFFNDPGEIDFAILKPYWHITTDNRIEDYVLNG